MSKININFNNKVYNVDEQSLSSVTTELKTHLQTVMNGSGATISFNGQSYNIDSTKLSNATNKFTSYLRTIAGTGKKIFVNGVEYEVDSNKLTGAVSELEIVLGNLHSGEDIDPNAVAFTVYSDEDKSLRFYKRSDIPIVGDKYNGLDVTAVYTGIEEDVELPKSPWFDYAMTITSVTIEDKIAPITTQGWFTYFLNCSSFNNLENIDTSNTKNMRGMFLLAGAYTTEIELTLPNWNTSNVENMNTMFYLAGTSSTTVKFTIPNWNTSNVTDMSGMFAAVGSSATTFELNLPDWDTSNVTTMNSMFEDTGKNATWSLDCSGWSVDKVTDYANFNKNVEDKVTPPVWVN